MNIVTSSSRSWATRHPVASWVITGIVAAGVLFALTQFQKSHSEREVASGSTDRVTVAPSALNFGARLEGHQFSWDLPVTNNSTQTVTFEKVNTSCNCAGIEPKTLTLLPNETKSFRLLLDLHGREDEGRDETSHEILVMAYTFGQEGRPHTWTIRGTSRRYLDIVPPMCDFAEELREGFRSER